MQRSLRRYPVVPTLLLAACTVDVPELDSGPFACDSDEDCADGYVCDRQSTFRCVPEDEGPGPSAKGCTEDRLAECAAQGLGCLEDGDGSWSCTSCLEAGCVAGTACVAGVMPGGTNGAMCAPTCSRLADPCTVPFGAQRAGVCVRGEVMPGGERLVCAPCPEACDDCLPSEPATAMPLHNATECGGVTGGCGPAGQVCAADELCVQLGTAAGCAKTCQVGCDPMLGACVQAYDMQGNLPWVCKPCANPCAAGTTCTRLEGTGPGYQQSLVQCGGGAGSMCTSDSECTSSQAPTCHNGMCVSPCQAPYVQQLCPGMSCELVFNLPNFSSDPWRIPGRHVCRGCSSDSACSAMPSSRGAYNCADLGRGYGTGCAPACDNRGAAIPECPYGVCVDNTLGSFRRSCAPCPNACTAGCTTGAVAEPLLDASECATVPQACGGVTCDATQTCVDIGGGAVSCLKTCAAGCSLAREACVDARAPAGTPVRVCKACPMPCAATESCMYVARGTTDYASAEVGCEPTGGATCVDHIQCQTTDPTRPLCTADGVCVDPCVGEPCSGGDACLPDFVTGSYRCARACRDPYARCRSYEECVQSSFDYPCAGSCDGMAPGTPCEGSEGLGVCATVRGFAAGTSTMLTVCVPCWCAGACGVSGRALFDQAVQCGECMAHADCPADLPFCEGMACTDPCAAEPCQDGRACIPDYNNEDVAASYLCVNDCRLTGVRCPSSQRCISGIDGYRCVPHCEALPVGTLCSTGGRCVRVDDGYSATSYNVCATCDHLGCTVGQTCAVSGSSSYASAVQCANCANHGDCPFDSPFCDSAGSGRCEDPCTNDPCGDSACLPDLGASAPTSYVCTSDCGQSLARCADTKVCVTDGGANRCVAACPPGATPGAPCTIGSDDVCVDVYGLRYGQSTIVQACNQCVPSCTSPSLCLWTQSAWYNSAAVCTDPCYPFPSTCDPTQACRPDSSSLPDHFQCVADCTQSGASCGSDKACVYDGAGGGRCRETCAMAGSPCIVSSTGADGTCISIDGPAGSRNACIPCATQPCSGHYQCLASSSAYPDLTSAEANVRCVCPPVADGWYAVGGSACGNGLLASGENLVSEAGDARPSIALMGDGHVAVGYTVDNAGTPVAQVAAWDNGTGAWGPAAGAGRAITATDGEGNSAEPEVVAAPDRSLYVAWAENAGSIYGGNRQVFLARAVAGGWTSVGARVDNVGDGTGTDWHGSNANLGVSFVTDAFGSARPALFVSPNATHMVLWREDDPTAPAASVHAARFDGNELWTRAGLQRGELEYGTSFSYPYPDGARIAGNINSTWAVWEANGHIYARQWTGTDWIGVMGSDTVDGLSGTFSAARPDIIVNKDGMPIIVWQFYDGSTSKVAVTMLATGAAPMWQGLCGTSPYSVVASYADAPAVAMSPADQPVVAYRALDSAPASIRVLACDGSSWRSVGSWGANDGISATDGAVLAPAIAAGAGPGPGGSIRQGVCVAWGQSLSGYLKPFVRCHDTDVLLLKEPFDGQTGAMLGAFGWLLRTVGGYADVWSVAAPQTGQALYVGATAVCQGTRVWTPEIPAVRDEMGSGTGAALDPGTADFLVEFDVLFNQVPSAYTTFLVAKGHAQNPYGDSGSFLLTRNNHTLYAGLTATALFDPGMESWYRFRLYVHSTSYDLYVYDEWWNHMASAGSLPFEGVTWSYDLGGGYAAPGRILFGTAGNGDCDYSSRGEMYVDNLRVTRLATSTP